MDSLTRRIMSALFGFRPRQILPYISTVENVDGGVATLSNGVKIAIGQEVSVGTKVVVVQTEGNPVGVSNE